MNKALKALEVLVEAFSNETTLNGFEKMKPTIQVLEQALTPPTPQDVEETLEVLNDMILYYEGINEPNKHRIALNTIRSYAFPQLSDDVEVLFERIQQVHLSLYGKQALPKLKQHILALQQENERLKESNDRQEYQLAVAWEQITDYENLINAIKQIIGGEE